MADFIGEENGYLILKEVAPFGTGFNVYKLDASLDDKDTLVYRKANKPLSFFMTEAAARKWVTEQLGP